MKCGTFVFHTYQAGQDLKEMVGIATAAKLARFN